MKPPRDLESKVALLMSLAADDRDGRPAGAPSTPPRLRNATRAGVLGPLTIRTVRPGSGPARSLLRILMTNACSFNCHYCPMRRDRNLPRTLLRPEELVRIFLGALRRGWCSGLFITTGIPGRPTKVMDDLIRVLELLRERHGYSGYIHTKVVPGGEPAQVERLTALATRVSVNLEAPCGQHLERIAPEKRLATTLETLERARALVLRSKAADQEGRPRDPLHPGGVAGMTMQFVVGATPDSDRTIIEKSVELSASGAVHHTHFSAFRPIRDTPMETVPAAPALREHRLYQVDHLLRTYGFGPHEIRYDERGNLPLARDPKVTWALAQPDRFPVEVRTAGYDELVRVPGIGPGTARRIVAERRSTVIRGLRDLARMGAVTSRAAGFLTVGGRRLRTERWTEQLGFWSPDEESGSPQLLYEVSPGTFR